jgi:hypothetical protein
VARDFFIGCARRSPTQDSEDAGSTPATSTHFSGTFAQVSLCIADCARGRVTQIRHSVARVSERSRWLPSGLEANGSFPTLGPATDQDPLQQYRPAGSATTHDAPIRDTPQRRLEGTPTCLMRPADAIRRVFGARVRGPDGCARSIRQMWRAVLLVGGFLRRSAHRRHRRTDPLQTSRASPVPGQDRVVSHRRQCARGTEGGQPPERNNAPIHSVGTRQPDRAHDRYVTGTIRSCRPTVSTMRASSH